MAEPNKRYDLCQNHYSDLVCASSSDPVDASSPGFLAFTSLRRLWRKLMNQVWYVRRWGITGYIKRMISPDFPKKRASASVADLPTSAPQYGVLNLQPGELVEIRSEKEIFSTLDRNQKLNGLAFQREMSHFCGKRYRVFKRLTKIIVESTGEKRNIRSPTVLLEGVICDGTEHGGCDRSCFLFWREEWLRRVAPDSTMSGMQTGPAGLEPRPARGA